MSETVDVLISLVFGVVVLTIYTTYHKSSGEKALQRWAEREGHTIIDSEWKWALYGPFFFTCTSRSQRVFKVTLRTKDGQIRKARVRLGGYFLGLMSDQVNVKWKEWPSMDTELSQVEPLQRGCHITENRPWVD